MNIKIVALANLVCSGMRKGSGAPDELVESIRAHGIIEPIVVRPLSSDPRQEKYEIIDGDRRFMAAKIAGLTGVTVEVIPVTGENASDMATLENTQLEQPSGHQFIQVDTRRGMS
jgi:ParB family transcriptional regulator, chromosome partitioning protein